jgi:hypothetical protein
VAITQCYNPKHVKTHLSQIQLKAALALNIGFLADALDDSAKQKLMSLQTDIDDFHFHGREIIGGVAKSKANPKFQM